MQAIIVAAGESSRCWPFNQGHKSQIKLLDKSLLYWTIKSLSVNGIKDIAVVRGPNSSLEDELAKANDLNANISYFVQEEPLGTGNAVSLARDFIKEPFFVFWPDKINSGEIAKDILKLAEQDQAEVVLTGAETDMPWDYGIFNLENNKLVEIVEKPEKGKEPSNFKALGAYLLQPDFFDYYQKLPKHRSEDFVDALNLYIKEKRTGLIIFEKEISALKYPWDLLEIMRIKFEAPEFESYISPTAVIGENVVIEGKVYIGDNCKIGSGSVLRGPINLGNNVAVGALAEIKNCLIQEGTHLHSGYFGDSVIGRNCRFGAGFVAANRRLDRGNIKSLVKGKKIDTGLTRFGMVAGDNSRFGIHCSTMPGVLIGKNCTVGPGSVVFENIEDNATFYTEFKKVVKK